MAVMPTYTTTSGKTCNRKDLGAAWMEGWRDGCSPTCPQVEGESGFNEIGGVALGAESPYRSAVCAAVWSGRHQFEPVSSDDCCWPTGADADPRPHTYTRTHWEVVH